MMQEVIRNRPDWGYWAYMPAVGLKTAVSLSLDIEPRGVEDAFTMWWNKVEKDSHKQQLIEALQKHEGFNDFGEWVSRLNIALANLNLNIKITKRPKPVHWIVGVGLPENSEVDLVSFGRFIESIGRTLPEGFPVAKDALENAGNDKPNAGTGHGQRALSECWDEYFLWSNSNNKRLSDSSFLDFLCTGKSKTYPKAKEESNLRKSKVDWRIQLDPALEPISWKTLTRFVKGKIE